MEEKVVPNSKKFKNELAKNGLTREDAKKENITTIAEIKEKRGIKGNVKVRKKSGAAKLADVFVSDDVHKVKDFVVMDVLVPAVKKAISDIVTNGIDMILYGETGRSRKRGPADKVSYRNYNDYSSRDRFSDRDRRDYRSSTSRGTYQYDEIIFESRGEAENVLMGMDAILDQYDIVRVADYYELVEVSCDHTAMNYGWSDLRSANIVRTRGGYMIKLPRPLPID